MLGYIRGERYSLAVDAGNSRRHVEKFYAALDAAELRRRGALGLIFAAGPLHTYRASLAAGKRPGGTDVL